MSKQTAVEWFSDNVWEIKNQLENKEITLNRFCSAYFKLYEEAKEMEKEQIITAYNEGSNQNGFPLKNEAEQYYSETYKNKTK
jgi:hypothetical protein